jgi:hypothetical protein
MTMSKQREVGDIAHAIMKTLESPNEADSNWENANVVDALFFIGRAIHRLADAVVATIPDKE